MRRAPLFLVLATVAGLGAACSTGSLDFSDVTPTLTPTATPSGSPTGSATPTPTPTENTGSGTTTSPATTVTASLPNATSGQGTQTASVLGAVIAWNGSGTPSVSDDAGNSWTQAVTGVSAGGNHVAIFYAVVANTSPNPVVTFNLTVPSRLSIIATEILGRDKLQPLPGAHTSSGTGTGTAESSGGITPGDTGYLLLGAAVHDAAATTTMGNGFTSLGIASDDVTTHIALAAEFKDSPSATSSTPATFSLSATSAWVAVAVAFQGP